VAPFSHAQVPVRIATWNIETVGVPGTDQYEAALAIIRRLDPDVLALNEIASDADGGNLHTLGAEAGYGYVAVPDSNPLGAMRNAIISRVPFAEIPVFYTSPALSGDAAANDLTRWIVEAAFDLRGAQRLYVLGEHWKSDTGPANRFRRGIESLRIRQALEGLDLTEAAIVVLGDVNEEIHDVEQPDEVITALPSSGLPQSFVLGADLAALFPVPGIRSHPFVNLGVGVDLFVIEALQLDGQSGTRPASGRRLDYVFTSAPIADLGITSEVYDSADEGLPGGLEKAGLPLAPGTSLAASDHLLVFADVLIPFELLCGDVDVTGAVDAGDVALLRAALVDPIGSPLSGAAQHRCPSAGADAGCELVDIVVLRRAVEGTGLLPDLETYCALNP
jgi:endonuclease/exonuclease/phosphatase family metal-dependent hydrolase